LYVDGLFFDRQQPQLSIVVVSVSADMFAVDVAGRFDFRSSGRIG